MTGEVKQVFTRRLAQCNKSELIVIMYDIFFQHLSDAANFHEKKEYDEFSNSLQLAIQVVQRLIEDLDFKYEIAKELYALYIFCRNELSKARYENKMQRVTDVEAVLRHPYEAFVQVAKADTTGPMMMNTQQVYAGLTYTRSNVNESMVDPSAHRGFFV